MANIPINTVTAKGTAALTDKFLIEDPVGAPGAFRSLTGQKVVDLANANQAFTFANQTEAETAASAAVAASADNTKVTSLRSIWYWWAKIKTLAATITETWTFSKGLNATTTAGVSAITATGIADSTMLGSELTDGTGWTSTNWTGDYSPNGFTHTAGNTSALSRSITGMANGKYYYITFTISGRTAGSVTPSCGGFTGSAISGNGAQVFAVSASSTAALTFTPTTDFNGKISSISVKENTGKQATLVFKNSTGSITAEYRHTNSNILLGTGAGKYLYNGTGNTIISSGTSKLINGSNNVYLGCTTMNSVNDSGNIAIGALAQINAGVSNCYVIGSATGSQSNTTILTPLSGTDHLVGIGTYTPSGKLTIINSHNRSSLEIGASDYLNDIIKLNIAGRNTGININNTNTSTYTSGVNIYGITSTMSSQIDSVSITSGNFSATYSRSILGTNINYAIGVRATASNTADSTRAWSLWADTKAYFAANVGVGILNPASKLHIDAGTGTASNIQFTAGTTTGQTSTDGFHIGISSAGKAEIRQRENDSILFYTNNTLSLELSSTGVLYQILGVTHNWATTVGSVTNNDWRIYGDATNFYIQRREAGAWVTKASW